ncbi:hypothetical protein D3C75_1118950 [compost metagenome]
MLPQVLGGCARADDDVHIPSGLQLKACVAQFADRGFDNFDARTAGIVGNHLFDYSRHAAEPLRQTKVGNQGNHLGKVLSTTHD